VVPPDFETMVRELPKGGVVSELGSFQGDSARAILEEAEPRELHLIDRDFSKLRRDSLSNDVVQLDIDEAKRKVKRDGLLVFDDYVFFSPPSFFPMASSTPSMSCASTTVGRFGYFILAGRGFCQVAVSRLSGTPAP
jgi:hypothetical protein